MSTSSGSCGVIPWPLRSAGRAPPRRAGRATVRAPWLSIPKMAAEAPLTPRRPRSRSCGLVRRREPRARAAEGRAGPRLWGPRRPQRAWEKGSPAGHKRPGNTTAERGEKGKGKKKKSRVGRTQGEERSTSGPFLRHAPEMTSPGAEPALESGVGPRSSARLPQYWCRRHSPSPASRFPSRGCGAPGHGAGCGGRRGSVPGQ